ncbi:MAG: peptidoglycan DD-metalloendopeptidase family protein [Candidatus Nitrospinota bacterium M3_3B_026]
MSARASLAVRILLAVSLAAGLFSCAPREAIRKHVYEKPSYDEKTGERYHVVRKGETLYRIARLHGVSVQDLISENEITDARDLKVGTRLKIPEPDEGAVAAAPPSRKTARTHVPSRRVSAKFIWPLKKFRVSSRFGVRHSSRHDGMDLAARKGTPILAAADGRVIFSGWGPSGYGRIVIIKHDSGAITVYAHNEKNLVSEGQRVSRGEKIATVGRSGRASGYHLHFELRISRKPVDPEKYLPPLG